MAIALWDIVGLLRIAGKLQSDHNTGHWQAPLHLASHARHALGQHRLSSPWGGLAAFHALKFCLQSGSATQLCSMDAHVRHALGQHLRSNSSGPEGPGCTPGSEFCICSLVVSRYCVLRADCQG
jgi:hypothetical protein